MQDPVEYANMPLTRMSRKELYNALTWYKYEVLECPDLSRWHAEARGKIIHIENLFNRQVGGDELEKAVSDAINTWYDDSCDDDGRFWSM
jgi:hypothetical protein